jgi:hypothetical protein
MGSPLARRIIQLKPVETKGSVIRRRVQQELDWLPLWAWIHDAAGNVGAAGWAHSDCSDSSNRYRSAVPSVRVFVDSGWQRRNVELVRSLAIQGPGCPLGLIDIDVELKLARVGSIGGNIERDLGIFLSSSVSSQTLMYRGDESPFE